MALVLTTFQVTVVSAFKTPVISPPSRRHAIGARGDRTVRWKPEHSAGADEAARPTGARRAPPTSPAPHRVVIEPETSGVSDAARSTAA